MPDASGYRIPLIHRLDASDIACQGVGRRPQHCSWGSATLLGAFGRALVKITVLLQSSTVDLCAVPWWDCSAALKTHAIKYLVISRVPLLCSNLDKFSCHLQSREGCNHCAITKEQYKVFYYYTVFWKLIHPTTESLMASDNFVERKKLF